MNLSETARLMALVQSFNNRTVGEADVVAWQSVLDDVALPDAEEAVRRHYRNSSEWIMPAHIRRAVELIELDRARAARRWAPGQAGVAPGDAMPELLPGEVTLGMSPEVRRLLDELRERLESGDRAKLFPRQAYWEREHQAFVRTRNAEPNPLYKPVAGSLHDFIPAEPGPERDEWLKYRGWDSYEQWLDRGHDGAGTPCGIPAPHPAHPWQIEANEGEAEADQFQCPGVDG